MKFERIAKFYFVLASGLLVSACQSVMLSDDRIVSNTAGVLGVSPADITIVDRRTDGPTNTYYVAKTKKGVEYACVINGGGLLAGGMTNPPICNRK